jgi:hypothetical protein
MRKGAAEKRGARLLLPPPPNGRAWLYTASPGRARAPSPPIRPLERGLPTKYLPCRKSRKPNELRYAQGLDRGSWTILEEIIFKKSEFFPLAAKIAASG